MPNSTHGNHLLANCSTTQNRVNPIGFGFLFNPGPLAVLMVDIDRFKGINDRYGHAAGDDALRAMAHVCRVELRADSDVIARLGGEEFAVLLPETDMSGGSRVGERLRIAVEAMRVPLQDDSLKFTVSVGVAVVQNGENDIEHTLRRADRALYVSKHSGRNCVCEGDADAEPIPTEPTDPPLG